MCRSEQESKTHVLGVVLSQLRAQLQRCRCRLHVLRAELGAEEQLRITETRVVTGNIAPDRKLVRPETGQSALWVNLSFSLSATQMNPSQLAFTSCYVPLFLFPFTDTAAASLPPRTAVRCQVPPGEGFPLAVLLFVLAEPAFNFFLFFFCWQRQRLLHFSYSIAPCLQGRMNCLG